MSSGIAGVDAIQAQQWQTCREAPGRFAMAVLKGFDQRMGCELVIRT